jgi:hypothetical protein
MKKEAEIKMACYALINTDEDITGNQIIEDIKDLLDIDEFEVEYEIN